MPRKEKIVQVGTWLKCKCTESKSAKKTIVVTVLDYRKIFM